MSSSLCFPPRVNRGELTGRTRYRRGVHRNPRCAGRTADAPLRASRFARRPFLRRSLSLSLSDRIAHFSPLLIVTRIRAMPRKAASSCLCRARPFNSNISYNESIVGSRGLFRDRSFTVSVSRHIFSLARYRYTCIHHAYVTREANLNARKRT